LLGTVLEGSWIEFYNPGDQDFAAKDVTRVCNKGAVFTYHIHAMQPLDPKADR
jgi:hypothetical protein